MASKKKSAAKVKAKAAGRRGRAPQMTDDEIRAFIRKQPKEWLGQSKAAALKAFRQAHHCEQSRFKAVFGPLQSEAFPQGLPKRERKPAAKKTAKKKTAKKKGAAKA